MVTGNGMIGRRFEGYKQQDQFLVYASGVSNSNCIKEEEFRREFNLLKFNVQGNPEKMLVYFSTCSILDEEQNDLPYVRHKLAMEEWIKVNCEKWVIFRISNPIGKTNNPNTFFNFFIKQILQQRTFNVWKFAARNILDIDDMFKICDYILQHRMFSNKIVNIANITNYSVMDIINSIEKYFNVKGKFHIINKGNGPLIPTAEIHPIISDLQIDFSHNYIERILKKYF